MIRIVFFVMVATAAFALPTTAQKKPAGSGYSTAAFAEVLLRRTELLAELGVLTEGRTDQDTRLQDVRYEIGELEAWLGKIELVKRSETAKLTIALGKLIVRRCALAAELHRSTVSLNNEHPDVKRARKRIAVYDDAIKELLP